MSPRLKRFLFQSLFYYLPGLLFLYLLTIYLLIRVTAGREEARPADFIVIFGAAQYNGRPSPVYKARLDHALALYQNQLAPTLITTGGKGIDLRFSEAEVGKTYLMNHAVPEARILMESTGLNTVESIQKVKELIGTPQNVRLIAVSDGFHLFRIKKILEDQHMVVYASPARHSPIELNWRSRTVASLRESFIFTAYKLSRWIGLGD
jgi:uncharacterized SAM-binding protein YcdF (DUF218 family)